MIRPYRPDDAPAIDLVCLRTAEAGGDATGLYASDELMPDVFARPYLAFAPELASVVEAEGGRVVGYILGVADTGAFVAWNRAVWVPRLAPRSHDEPPRSHDEPPRSHDEPPRSRDDLIRHLGLTPERMLVPELTDYPAHLHIDLLPEAQGGGWGRRLIEELADALRKRAVPGVHLSMDPANTGARAFYDRLGFVELPSSTPAEPLLGLRLG